MLTVVGPAPRKYNQVTWSVRCECGTMRELPASALRRGNTKSCGCLRYTEKSRNAIRARTTKHGHNTPGTPVSATYVSWYAMTSRCHNPKSTGYSRYGGRGIKVCERWRDFRNFLADMGERPPGCSIDRFPNNDGDYEPANARWATTTEQIRNTSRTRLTLTTAQEAIGRLEHGESLSAVARRFKVNPSAIAAVRDGKTWKEVTADQPFQPYKAPPKS